VPNNNQTLLNTTCPFYQANSTLFAGKNFDYTTLWTD